MHQSDEYHQMNWKLPSSVNPWNLEIDAISKQKWKKFFKKTCHLCSIVNLSIITRVCVFEISLAVFKHPAGVYEYSKIEFKYPPPG